jgi:hypothetical protein
MNWLLLLPSTWNPATAWQRLLYGTNAESSQALSDVFITSTVYLGAAFLLWSLWLTLRSWWRTNRYRQALRGVTDYTAVRQKLQANQLLPLFRGLHHHLVEIPLRDGSDRTESRRTVEAAEIFTDDILAPGLSSSRIFQALPGILTGLGVLGTFVGLQLGIGGLDLRGSPDIKSEDLKEAPALIARLLTPANPVAQELWSRFDADAKSQIAALPPEEAKDLLAKQLSKVIRDNSFTSSSAFADIKESSNSSRLKDSMKTDADHWWFNRSRLHDAFLAHVTPQSSSADLEKSIYPLIAGCAIAFSTSVWGVIASLLFSFFEKALEAFGLGGVRKLQTQIDSLIPRYVPEEAMAELERSSRGSHELLQGLAVAIGNAMQQAIGTLGEQIRDAVATATKDGQGPMAEHAAKILSESLTRELETIRKGVEGFQPEVKTLSETVSGARTAVTDAVAKLNAHEAVMGQMADAVKELKLAAESFANMRGTLETSALRNEEAAKAQQTAATANQEVAAKFSAIGERLPEVRQTIEDAARVIGSLGGPIAELQTLLAKQPELQQQLEGQRTASEEERSTRLLNLSTNLAGTVTKAVEEFAKVGAVAQQLSAASTSLEEASNELAVFGQQVLQASQQQRVASEASLNAASASERTTVALTPLPGAFAELAGGLTQAATSVKEGAESVAGSYDRLIELQRLWFDGAKVGLNTMKERLQEIIGSYGAQIEGQTQNLMNQWTQQVAECLKTYENQVETLEGGLEDLQDAISKIQRSA